MTDFGEDFESAFFEDDDAVEMENNNNEDDNVEEKIIGGGDGTKNKIKSKNDDAISIGSSSSSDDDDSSTSSGSSSDGSVVSVPFKKKVANRIIKKEELAETDSDDDSDVTIPLKRNPRQDDNKSTSKGLTSNIGEDLDDDLEEDDDDDLVDFFSSAPTAGDKTSKDIQIMDSNNNKNEGKEGDNYGFNSLDDDDMADLEENDSVNGARGSGTSFKNKNTSSAGGDVVNNKKDGTTSNNNPAAATIKRDFTISYNCEKKECPMEEAIESSDDEVGGALGVGKKKKTNKENSSPNLKTKSSSYFEKKNNSSVEEQSNDEILELFGNDETTAPAKKKKSSPPDSPASLDTPRAEQEEEEERMKSTAATSKPTNPYQNSHPCQQRKQQQGQRQLVQESRSSTSNDVPPQRSSNQAPLNGGIVELPDIGLNPNANQSEIDTLGITHSQFKPPPYSPSSDPIVHKLNSRNRPQNSRRTIPVSQIFSGPVQNLWKQSKFTSFNHVQSEMCNVLANSDDNVIVSAPTGAGKTALFEMAMARLFNSSLTGSGIGCVSKARKVVYIAPNKALCEERQADWSKRLTDIDPGILCTTITGDVNASSSYNEISNSQLILTTPEKWDSITRKWNDQFVLLSSIKLVLIDEVHMIGETDRGGTLESVISRMKTIQRAACVKTLSNYEIASSSYKNTTPEALTSNMRIVAVSATLPNLGQLASFVESGEAYVFDQSYRPVPLNIYVQACGHIGSNRYLFDKSLNQHVPSILKRFSNGRPAIVFCHSKKETEQLAEELTKSYSSSRNDSVLTNFAGRTDSAALHRCIRKGMAFHHAGLDASDRRLVEEAFGSGVISCLCATSTLAMGVNLPSHLVIIKGTSAYRGAGVGHQDIDASSLLQMMGRAGRPGHDTSGTSVIMTDSLSKTRYENVSQGLKVVESHLESKLTEVLNIEISQGVITSAEDAVNWVKSSFLYQRIQSNPLFYGFNGKGSDALHSFILDKCTNSINKLQKIKAISVEEDGTFSPLAASHIMSRNFVDYETMKSIVKLPHDSGPVQLLHFMSNCTKIQTQVRRDEKKHLNAAYKLIKYKLEGPQSKIRIQTHAEKAFVMLQSAIGQHYFQDGALRQQMSNMIDGASQILSAVEQYAKEGSRNGAVAAQGMLFRRSLYSSLWGENDGVLNQIGGVTQEMAARLKESGISTFADAVDSSSEDIARACNVTTTFASSLRAAASKILQRTLKLSACSKEADDGGLELHVKLERRVAAGSVDDSGERIVSYSLLVFTDRAGGMLHYSEQITNECEMRVKCPATFGRAYIRLVSNLVGLDEQVTIDGNCKIQKSSFDLSPAVAKSSKGKKKQSKIFAQPPPTTTSRKRQTFDGSHRNSISKVSDMRLHKRGRAEKKDKVQEEDDDCIIVDPDAVEYDLTSRPAKESGGKKSVTPSPHPRTGRENRQQKNLTPVRGTTAASSQRSEKTNQTSKWSKNTNNNNRRGPRNARSSWFQEKSSQKTAQQTAFHSPKENPFNSYSFDPNNIESSLNASAEQSIIPSNVTASTYSRSSSRTNASRSQPFKTPAAHGRRKNSATSNRISASNLLAQKASELQQHHATTRTVNRGRSMSMQQDLSNVGNQYSNEYGMGQQSFHEADQFMGQSQGNYFPSGASVMQASVMQQSFGAPEQQSLTLTPPPPFMGRGRSVAQNNNFMHGPMAGRMRPTGGSVFSQHQQQLGVGSGGHVSFGGPGMLSQQQHFNEPNHFMTQDVSQQQFGGGSQFGGGDSVFHSRQQGMPQFQQHEQQQPAFDDFNGSSFGLDPYGHRDQQSQFGGGFGGMSVYQQPGASNPYSEFGGPGNMPQNNPYNQQVAHNPYQQQQPSQNPYQQQHSVAPSNPYRQPAQRQPSIPYNQHAQRQPAHNNPYAQQQPSAPPPPPPADNPPINEVVVNNTSVGSRLHGEEDDCGDTFCDAFY